MPTEETSTEARTTVILGNNSPQMQVDGVSVPAEHLNQSETRVVLWEGFDNEEAVNHSLSTSNDRVLSMIGRSLSPEHKKYAVGINEIEQILSVHSAGNAPAYVTSDDSNFADAIAEFYACPVGSPTNLLTTVGRDSIHAQHLSTSAQPATFNYIALTANNTAASAGSTTLTGEISTAGGGLLRALSTYAHTGGTNTTTLTKTFTANGTDALPVTVAKIGVFNAATVGTLAYETLLNATATLTTSGDNVAITETVTIG
jgi:hypothetical protein